MRLRLSEKAAKQLGGRFAPKTPEEKAAERAAKEKERTERDAKARLDREEKEKFQQQQRERIKSERNDADTADTELRAALTDYHEVERAINPKEREKARLAAEESVRAVAAAEDALRRAEQKLADAANARERAREEHERLEGLAHEKLPAAKDALLRAWNVNDGTWRRTAVPYRKKHRDRSLKNAVKGILGIKGGED